MPPNTQKKTLKKWCLIKIDSDEVGWVGWSPSLATTLVAQPCRAITRPKTLLSCSGGRKNLSYLSQKSLWKFPRPLVQTPCPAASKALDTTCVGSQALFFMQHAQEKGSLSNLLALRQSDFAIVWQPLAIILFRWMSFSRIWQHVWCIDACNLCNIIENYMSNLPYTYIHMYTHVHLSLNPNADSLA